MFDTTLVASNPGREVRRKLATLPAALAIHAMALGFVMVGQLWAVDHVIEPAVMEPYVDVQLPTPPPAPPAAPKGEDAATPKAAAPEPVQITQVPPEPAKAGPPEAPGTASTVPGGDDHGGPGTIPGGGTDGPVPPPPPPPHPEAPVIYTLDSVSTPPVAKFQPSPVYPEVAQHARIQGTVVIHAVIDETGDVVDVHLIQGLRMGCSEAALEAVRSWKYQPATLHGRSVSVQLDVNVTFRLAEGS